MSLPRWRWCTWSDLDRDLLYEIVALREAVFVVEQRCPYQEVDGRDPVAHHLAGHLDGRLVAYLRVFPPGVARPEAVIGRVLTHAEVRGAGFGRSLMSRALEGLEARWPAAPVWLSAQAHLEGWYGAFGFEVCGPGYDEDGIPHLPMCRSDASNR